jgi:hypothetical protein
MWYSRTIIAAIEDAINALKSKGVSESLINYIQSLPDNQKGKAIGALNQNPSMTLIDLEALFESGYKPSAAELQLVNNYGPRFKSWALHQYKLFRSNKMTDDPYDDRWEYKESLGRIKNSLDEIHDFYRTHSLDNPNYNIGTKSFEEALEDSAEWHNAMAQRGSGKFYLPFQRDESGNLTDEKIVHKFEDGSMMVKVEDPNDLDVEGNFMHHCVGSYADKVDEGSCIIYSLRNKFNQPEATIEVGRDGRVKQIKGPSNSKIDDETQVAKIKEFFENRDDIKKESGGQNPAANYFENWEDRVNWGHYPDEIGYAISESIYGPDESEYDDFDDDYTEDFNRFGIESPSWDHQKFAEGNLYGSHIPDIMNSAINSIEFGLERSGSAYNFNNEKFEIDDYPIEDYVNSFYQALIHKAELALKQNPDDYKLEKHLDVNGVLEAATKKFEEALQNYEKTDKKELFWEWYQKQPEFMYFLLAEKLQDSFETSEFAEKYKEIKNNDYKLPSGRQKYYWDEEEITPFLKTKEIRKFYEDQVQDGKMQLRLFAPESETMQENESTVDKFTNRPMTSKDESWAYANVYNNKNFKKF